MEGKRLKDFSCFSQPHRVPGLVGLHLHHLALALAACTGLPQSDGQMVAGMAPEMASLLGVPGGGRFCRRGRGPPT